MHLAEYKKTHRNLYAALYVTFCRNSIAAVRCPFIPTNISFAKTVAKFCETGLIFR